MVRRDILKASALLAGLSAPTTASADGESVTAGDVQRVAVLFYGQSLPGEDAATIAEGAATGLANLKYIAMLKSDDVQTPFGYPALIAEASRG